ncbi:hypothetical protein [Streptomyces sp. NPDC057616]|uniref:hypothetical protein n=1 Tax=Streptomyces sp. NPDC057616 TaxID=3346183 RepID=UPI0036ADDC70
MVIQTIHNEGGYMGPLKEYIVVNERLIEGLYRQFAEMQQGPSSSENEVSASLKFLSLRHLRSSSAKTSTPHDHDVIEAVVESLRETGQLHAFRPDRAGDFWHGEHAGWYVHEQMIATPVIVPLEQHFEGLQVPQAVTVWISDPTPPQNPAEWEYDIVGSFIFLVQEMGELKWPMRWFMSGISALRMVANFMAGGADYRTEGELHRVMQATRDQFEMPNGWGDENDERHPIEKLKSVGGMPGRPRRIETVYRIAYMSDEQCIPTDSGVLRVNDVLAYPLYIAE